VAFILYDLETSGLNKRFDQILQFAAVRADADLVETHRFETKSRLMPHLVPSPQALHITGHTLDEASSLSRQSHYSMVCEVANKLASWCPATFLGYNSIRFDEEFLRQAFYQCLHPVFLTNTNGNARADILNLMRAATTLHPSVIRPGVEIDGRFSHRLGALAAANAACVAAERIAMSSPTICPTANSPKAKSISTKALSPHSTSAWPDCLLMTIPARTAQWCGRSGLAPADDRTVETVSEGLRVHKCSP